MSTCAVCGAAFASRGKRGAHERWAHGWTAPPEIRATRGIESREAWTAKKSKSQLFLIWSNAQAKRFSLPPMDPDTVLPTGPCVYCGTTEEPMTWDHIESMSRGGAHEVANLARSCRPCNQRKSRYGVESAEAITVLCGWCWKPLRRRRSSLFRRRMPAYFACGNDHLNAIRGYLPLPFGHPLFPRPRRVAIETAT